MNTPECQGTRDKGKGRTLVVEDTSAAIRFRALGFECPIPVLSAAEVTECRRALSSLDRALGPRTRFQQAHLYLEWAFNVVTHSAVVEAVAQVLGDDVVAWGSLVLSKPPDRASFVPWHQDGAYRPTLKSGDAITAWIALTESRAVHGCLRVIPGSHYAVLPHAPVDDRNSLLKNGQEIAPELRVAIVEEEAVDLELHAGEMSLHDLNTLHSSRPNCSDHDRIGFIVRYATPHSDLPVPATQVVRVHGAGIASRDDVAPPSGVTLTDDDYASYGRYLASLPSA